MAELDDIAGREPSTRIQVVAFASDALGMKPSAQGYLVTQLALKTDPGLVNGAATGGRLPSILASQREASAPTASDPARGLPGAPDMAVSGSAGRVLL